MTASGQMYLKAVCYLSAQSGKTRAAQLAEALCVSRQALATRFGH